MKSDDIARRQFHTVAITVLLATVMYVALLIIDGVVPFGDSTWLMFDTKRQYMDYYSYLRTIWSGENNVIYSFSTALGSGIWGFCTYYLTSPFLFIIALFPQEQLPMAVTIIIELKIVLAAALMAIFLQNYTELKDEGVPANRWIVILGAISWAYSGYFISMSMNMMWTDVVLMLPIVIMTLEHLIRTGYKLPYIISIALMLIFNYYISYMVLLFIAMWTIFRLVEMARKHPWPVIGRVVLATALGGLADSVILLPTGLELINSPKDITKLGLEASHGNIMIRDVLSKLPSLSYDYIEARFGFPQLFIGVLLLILGIMFFTDSRRPKRTRICYGVLLIIFLLSFCIDTLNVIWHAGMEPSGHPYRQAFLCIFVMLLCAYESLQDLVRDWANGDEGRRKNYYIGLGLAVVLLVIMYYEVLRIRFDHISQLTIYINWLMLACYTIALIVIIWTMGRARFRKLGMIMLALVCLAQIADMEANAIYIHHYEAINASNSSEYSDTIESVSEAVNWVKLNDDSFYRMENLNPRQENDAMQYDYKGVTHYSSAGMLYVRYLLQRLGYNDDSLYTHYGHDNTATMDSLLGVKYILTDGTYEPHPSYELEESGDTSVYRNPYALTAAIGVTDYDLSDISYYLGEMPNESTMEHVPGLDAFSLQEEIYSRLVGSPVDIFREASVTKDSSQTEDSIDETYTVTVAEDGELYMYIAGILGQIQSLGITVDGEFLTGYGNDSCLKILNLGYHNAGDTLTVQVTGYDTDVTPGQAIFVTENIEALSEAYDKVSTGAINIYSKSSSHIGFKTADSNGVWLSIPCEAGWHITVDGSDVTPMYLYDSLMYIPLDDCGEHTVDMRFIPRGLALGIILTILSLGAITADAVVTRRRRFIVEVPDGQ